MRKLFFIFSFLFFSTTLIAEEQIQKDGIISTIKGCYFFSTNTRIDVKEDNLQLSFPYICFKGSVEIPHNNRFLFGVEYGLSFENILFDAVDFNFFTFDFAPKVGIYNRYAKNFINFNIFPIYLKNGINSDIERNQISTAVSFVYAREMKFKLNEKEKNYLGFELFLSYNFNEIMNSYLFTDVKHKLKGFTFGAYITFITTLAK